MANLTVEGYPKGLLGFPTFFTFVRTDRASLHAVMLMAVLHYQNVNGVKSHNIDLLQLRGWAISEINSAIENRARAISDQLITAVAMIAAYESISRDKKAYQTHMTGLRNMVTLRGGLQSLGLDGLLESILLWVASNAAHFAGSGVYFDKKDFPASSKHPKPNPKRFAGVSPRASAS